MFVDVIPGADHKAYAERLFAAERAASKADTGCERFVVLEQIGLLQNHFTLSSVWHDAGAFAAHEGSSHTRAFRKALQPLIGSPVDERVNTRIE